MNAPALCQVALGCTLEPARGLAAETITLEQKLKAEG